MRTHYIVVGMLAVIALAPSVRGQEITPEQTKFFETKIRPVLIRECYSCHSNKTGNARGGLRLDTRELMHIGGSSGPAIVPGSLDESMLYNAIIYQDFEMPPNKPLSQNVINDFKTWIEMGAPDPRTTTVKELNSTITDEDIEKAKQEFWAYKKPVKHSPPTVEAEGWTRTGVDRFVMAKLESQSMKPAQDAQPSTILRRLCFDLIGLPPSPEQIEYFNRYWRESPDKAIRFVTDRLLDKQQFGERWGRHWLDIARYAESSGREVNQTYPHAWRYRDYVIDSFNNDKPYDRFIQEQIAGDLLPVKTDEQWSENLVATTFLAMGPKNVNEQNAVQFAADLADEQIDVTTRVVLATSVACARCHDHKFDPIPQTDYYALASIFSNMTTYFGVPASSAGIPTTAQAKRTSNLLRLPVGEAPSFRSKISTADLDKLKDRMAEAAQGIREARRSRASGNQNALRTALRLTNEVSVISAKVGSYESDGTPICFCMGVQAKETPKDVRLLVRGEIDQPAQVVRRGFPKVLSNSPDKISQKSSGRLEFARWATSQDNPLTARVMVNRIWQHLVGHGIVRSTENFGSTGQLPTHPELLDYLSVGFMESGWSVKTVIREIVTSRIYRTSSRFNERYHEQDPDNELLWRMNPRRLDAESMRDSMLFVSGTIDLDRPEASEVAKAGYMRVRDGNLINIAEVGFAMGATSSEGMREAMRAQFQQRQSGGRFRGGNRRPGFTSNNRNSALPSVADFTPGTDRLDMAKATYRSIYLPIVRDEVPRSLEVFDFAEPSMVVGTRESSNTPNQALYLMNNPFVVSQSDALARRIVEEASSVNDRIERAFILTYGRKPHSSELIAVRDFFQEFGMDSDRSKMLGFSAFCQSLLASAEFRYID